MTKDRVWTCSSENLDKSTQQSRKSKGQISRRPRANTFQSFTPPFQDLLGKVYLHQDGRSQHWAWYLQESHTIKPHCLITLDWVSWCSGSEWRVKSMYEKIEGKARVRRALTGGREVLESRKPKGHQLHCCAERQGCSMLRHLWP